MSNLYVREGRYYTYTSTGAVSVGDVKILGAMPAVALDSATGSGVSVQLDTQGVHTVTRTAASTLTAVGSNVYFTSTGAAVATATGNVYGGKLAAAAATADTTCQVDLNKGAPVI